MTTGYFVRHHLALVFLCFVNLFHQPLGKCGSIIDLMMQSARKRYQTKTHIISQEGDFMLAQTVIHKPHRGRWANHKLCRFFFSLGEGVT